MAIPRHNAHMKIAKHVWDRAARRAILLGQSMTEFTEDALAAWCNAHEREDDTDEQESDAPVPG